MENPTFESFYFSGGLPNSYEGELTKELTEGILQVYKSVNAMIIEKGNITEHDKRIINALMENSLIECYEDAMD